MDHNEISYFFLPNYDCLFFYHFLIIFRYLLKIYPTSDYRIMQFRFGKHYILQITTHPFSTPLSLIYWTRPIWNRVPSQTLKIACERESPEGAFLPSKRRLRAKLHRICDFGQEGSLVLITGSRRGGSQGGERIKKFQNHKKGKKSEGLWGPSRPLTSAHHEGIEGKFFIISPQIYILTLLKWY